MKYIKTGFKDLYVIEPEIHHDNRGFFMESFKKKSLENVLGYSINFCQDNKSLSSAMVLRGLHFQNEPFSQSKLISVSYGKILDVVVDIRKNSDTYGKYFSINLSSENHKMLFIPKGFAHGFLSLCNNTIVNYKVDDYYNKNAESGIFYDDISLKIDWEINKSELLISKKDNNLPMFKW